MLIKRLAIRNDICLIRVLGPRNFVIETKCKRYGCVHRDPKYNCFNDLSNVCIVCNETSKIITYRRNTKYYAKYCYIPR